MVEKVSQGCTSLQPKRVNVSLHKRHRHDLVYPQQKDCWYSTINNKRKKTPTKRIAPVLKDPRESISIPCK